MFVKRMMRDYDLVDKRVNLEPCTSLSSRACTSSLVLLDRNAGAVPLEMTEEYRETLRLAPVLAEGGLKASCVPATSAYQYVPRPGLALFFSSWVCRTRSSSRVVSANLSL
jgi:hypothetical protein